MACFHRTMLKSKIHRATVTHADLHYVGSITIDAELLDAADVLPGELVTVVNINTGARFETYAIQGERDSGVMGINGAAARLAAPGDLVIVISWAWLDAVEAASFAARIVHVNESNRILELGDDPAAAVAEGVTAPPRALGNL